MSAMEPLFLRRRPLPGNRSPLRIRPAVAWIDLVTSKASARVSTANSPRGGEVDEAGRTSVCPPSAVPTYRVGGEVDG